MLSELRVHAYRGISGLTLDDLRSVSIIVGPNDAGKTSVLEAAALLAEPTSLSVWPIVARAPLLVGVHGAVVDMFPAVRPDRGRALKLEGILAGARRVVDVTLTGEQQVTADPKPGASVLLDTIRVAVGGAAPVARDIRVYTDGLGANGLAAPSAAWMVTRNMAPLALLVGWSDAIRRGRKELVLRALQLLDPRVRDIDNVMMRDGTQQLMLTHEARGTADLRSFGDGVQSSFAIATWLAAVPGGLLLIDELGATVHMAALRSTLGWLVEAAAQLDVQVIATTHSLEVVDAVLSTCRSAEADLTAYWLDRRSDGPHATRYSMSELERARAHGLDVR